MAATGRALLQDLEADCFANSEQRVLAAYVVTKCEPAPVGSRMRRALPKSTGKPRVLCLTAKRRNGKRGFKGTLHVCKLAQGRYQVRKSVRLKLLTRIEAFVDSPGQQEYFELTFLQRGFTSGEVRLAFEAKNAQVRQALLGSLYTFCREHEGRAPQVAGIDAAELESSGSAALRGAGRTPETDMGPAGKALLQEGAREEEVALALAAVNDDGEGVPGLWGQREDKQVQSLLEMVSAGAASMEELQERLQAELAALEDASVHEILENGGMVGRVLGELGATAGLLDDLEESLSIFDARLRHMREDISAIEDRNNQLELHSRNNQKLLGALEGLVGRLALDEGAERALQARAITSSSLPAMVEAAWDLHTRLQALSPPADGNGATAAGAAAAAAAAAGGGEGEAGEARLPSAMAGMSVVSAQRQRLHGVQRSFVDKASSYLQEEFGRIAEPALQQVVALQGAQRKRPVEHGSLRRRAAELAPLLEVVGVLRPAATVAPREAYCQAVNALLRREVHAAASEAKRSAAAADAGGTHEPDLFDRAAATDSASTLERMSAVPSSTHGFRPSVDLGASYRDAGITPIHEGYEALLDSHMPVLAEEAQQCIALMFPRASQGQPREGRQPEARPPVGAKSVRFEGGRGAAEPAAALSPAEVGGAEVQGTLASLLAGVDAELLGVIEAVKPQRTLLCLPMLAATLGWKQRLVARGAVARPLTALLGQCEQRLTVMLQGYILERAAAIQRYDGRSSMPSVGGSTVKGQHVLPFIANFPAVAARVEALLERWPPEAQQQQQQQQAEEEEEEEEQQRTPGSAAAAGVRRPPLAPTPAGGRAQVPPLGPSPFQSSSIGSRQTPGGWRGAAESAASEVSSLPLSSEEAEVEEISFMETEETEASSRRTTASGEAAPQAARGARAAAAAQQPAAPAEQQQRAPGPGDALRELLESGYSSWLRAMAAAVEALGIADAKHGTRLRLENYGFWQLGLQSLPQPRLPVLEAFAAQVTALKDRAMAGYIEQQVDYFKFSRVLELSRKLDEAAAAVGVDEVHLQMGYQPAEVRQLLSTTVSGLDKKLAQVFQRIQKHLGATSPYLVDQVWDKLEAICLDRWRRMEQQLAQCYRGIELRPPPDELRRWFRAARQQ